MVDLTGWTLTFDEEFDARSISQDGSATTWSDIRPQWRQDAESDTGFGHSSFVDAGSGYDPFSVSGGALTVTAVPDRTPYGVPGSWESGLISTRNSFSQTYGYFEMRAETAGAPGSWDAFWMLPEQPTANQELDIMEHLGDDDAGTYSTIHTTDPTPAQQLQVYSRDTAREAGYHTYGMDWEPDRITFYVDGQSMGSQATPSDMHSPMYLLADLATQSDASGSSMSMAIDYIRAFSKDPGATAVLQGAVSAPDGQDPGLYGATSARPVQFGSPAPAVASLQSATPLPVSEPVSAAVTDAAASAPATVAPSPEEHSSGVLPVASGDAPLTESSSVPSQAAAVSMPPIPAALAGADEIADAASVFLRADGRRLVDVKSHGAELTSVEADTYLNHAQPDNVFTFNPGYGLDVVRRFLVGGADHDILNLPSSDFGSIADVLSNTRSTSRGAEIVDPVSQDVIRLPGVGKFDIYHNFHDITFHP